MSLLCALCRCLLSRKRARRNAVNSPTAPTIAYQYALARRSLSVGSPHRCLPTYPCPCRHVCAASPWRMIWSCTVLGFESLDRITACIFSRIAQSSRWRHQAGLECLDAVAVRK